MGVTEDRVSLADFLRVVFANARTIAYVCAAAAVFSALFSLTIPNRYSATARVIPPKDDMGLLGAMMSGVDGLGGIAGGMFDTSKTASKYLGILESETIRDEVIARNGLREVYGKDTLVDTRRQLDKYVDVKLKDKSSIIEVTATDRDPSRAAAIANSLIDELGRVTVELRTSDASRKSLFLQERLAEASADLTIAEEALKSFQSETGAVNIGAQSYSALNDAAMLRARLTAQEVRLAGLLSYQTDRSPEVVTTRAAIEKLRERVGDLESRKVGASLTVDELPEVSRKYMSLVRDLKIQEALVVELTKQLETEKLVAAEGESSLQILDRAIPPDKKSSPHRAAIVVLSTLTALFLVVLFVFLRELNEGQREGDRLSWRELSALVRRSGG